MTRVLAALTSSLVGVLVFAGCAATNSGDTSTGSAGKTSLQPWQQAATPTAGPDTEAPEPATEPPTPAPTSATERPAPTPTPEAGAPGSTEITGTGYTYDVPEGWGPPRQEVPGMNPDSMAFDLSGKDSFPNGVNVLLAPEGELTPAQIETDGVQGLKLMGATRIAVNRRVSFAGSESAHLSAKMSMGTNKYVVDQFFLTDDGQTYAVTFSFSRSASTRERRNFAREVLATWTWTD